MLDIKPNPQKGVGWGVDQKEKAVTLNYTGKACSGISVSRLGLSLIWAKRQDDEAGPYSAPRKLPIKAPHAPGGRDDDKEHWCQKKG